MKTATIQSTDGLVKLRTQQADAVCSMFELSPQGAALLEEIPDSASLLSALMAAELWVDAIRFLAYGLPARHAVWWACLCARATIAGGANARQEAALASAEAWVLKPTESNRRAAEACAQEAGYRSAASWAAVAAVWSGGSLAPPDVPAVPPKDGLSSTAVASAIQLAATTDPFQVQIRFREFLEWGIDIARGGRGQRPPAGA